MTVIHGSAADAYLNGMDVGNYFNSCKSSHQRDVLESTVFNSGGVKTYTGGGHKNGTVSASGLFDSVTVDGVIITDDTDTGEYGLNRAIENQLSTTPDNFLYFPGGAVTLGDRGVGFEGFVSEYDIDTDEAALSTANLQMQGCKGREPVRLLAPLATRTNSFTGTSIDNTVGTTAGAAGYVMVTGFTSGSVPILIEHSTDNSAWSTLMTFTAITAKNKWQRIETSGTVNRYVRASANGTYVAFLMAAFNRK